MSSFDEFARKSMAERLQALEEKKWSLIFRSMQRHEPRIWYLLGQTQSEYSLKQKEREVPGYPEEGANSMMKFHFRFVNIHM